MKYIIPLLCLLVAGCVTPAEQAHNAAVIQADAECTGKTGKPYTACYKAAMARLEPIPYSPQPRYTPVYSQPVYQAPVYQPYIQQPYVMQTPARRSLNCTSSTYGQQTYTNCY